MSLLTKLCRNLESLNSNLLRFDFKLLSSSHVKYSQSPEKKEDLPFNPNYVNRNPRNLEWSGDQYKRFGWNLQYPSKDFYHRCKFRNARSYLEGTIEHSSGKIVVKASTRELAFQQYLYSSRDVCAAMNLGRLLAIRCLKAGITNFDFLKSINFDNSQREQAFYNALLENGVSFDEPEFQAGAQNLHGLDYDNQDFSHERGDVPFPPTINRIKRKLGITGC